MRTDAEGSDRAGLHVAQQEAQGLPTTILVKYCYTPRTTLQMKNSLILFDNTNSFQPLCKFYARYIHRSPKQIRRKNNRNAQHERPPKESKQSPPHPIGTTYRPPNMRHPAMCKDIQHWPMH
jgi:hypothetical protein